MNSINRVGQFQQLSSMQHPALPPKAVTLPMGVKDVKGTTFGMGTIADTATEQIASDKVGEKMSIKAASFSLPKAVLAKALSDYRSPKLGGGDDLALLSYSAAETALYGGLDGAGDPNASDIMLSPINGAAQVESVLMNLAQKRGGEGSNAASDAAEKLAQLLARPGYQLFRMQYSSPANTAMDAAVVAVNPRTGLLNVVALS